jgi:NAD(P)-dependent dehydrogenase (short-subunit alcohol dehydrogenase family)
MKNAVAIVTGASQDIGRATAIRLALDFSGVALVARNGAKLEATANEVKRARLRTNGARTRHEQCVRRRCRQCDPHGRRRSQIDLNCRQFRRIPTYRSHANEQGPLQQSRR